MSLQALAAVVRAPMPPLAKVVLFSLADEATRDGRNCFLSVSTIQKENGIGRSSVQRKLRQLEQFGFIETQPYPEEDPRAAKIPRDKRPQCYRIVMPAGELMGRWPMNADGKFITDPQNILDDPRRKSSSDGNTIGASNHEASHRGTGTTFRAPPPPTGPQITGPHCGAPPQIRASGASNSGERGITPGAQPLSITHINPSAGAREGGPVYGAADGDGVPDTPEGPVTGGGEPVTEGATATAEDASSEPSMAARWRKCRPALVACFGEAFTRSWWDKTVPEGDDGKTLSLAAPSRFVRDRLRGKDCNRLGALIGRKVVIEHRMWCTARAHAEAKT